MKKDLKSLTRTEIKEVANVLGFEKYRGDQIFEWIYKGAKTIDDMKTLGKEQKDALVRGHYYISSIKAVKRAESKIDGTIKYLFELEDGKKIESVFLPGKERNSLCISSQVGCACKCGFCATGSLGFTRDLTAGEIISQFMYPIQEEGLKIDNIVFMGMGEPLLNWPNVKKTIENLNDEKGFHFSRSRITVSTIGILPVMKEIADAKLKFKLAVSIITANNTLRTKLIPMNTKYPLADVVKMCKYYNHKTEQPVMVEYPLFGGLNDSLSDAEALHRLMNGVDYKLNIIPYNSVEGKEFKKPEPENAIKFQKYFMDKGVMAFNRKEKGADIAGACGQLAGGE